MRRLSLLLLLALFVALPVGAQQDQRPVYRIYVNTAAKIDNGQVTVVFGVTNTGGKALSEATAVLTEAATGALLATQPIPPLATGEIKTVTFTFAASKLTPGQHSLRASINTDSGGTVSEGNTASTGILIPGGANATAEAAAGGSPEATAVPGALATPRAIGFTIPGLNRYVDLTQPQNIILTVVVIVIILVLLWVITVILRLLFQKTPKLTAWQPPYASTPMLDPNSSAGRRQLWQPHAQNDAITSPCVEGNYHIRKLLLGIDGDNLSGWRVSAIRLSQYDMYGRVARSQTIAQNGLTKRLDKAARKGSSLDDDKAFKMVRPVAKSLVASFDKRVTDRNAMLPIALDIRLRGTHGEVQILFELYGCMQGYWQVVDQWEPDMIVTHGSIHENFTYTVFGQQPTEQRKAFRQRLETELSGIMAAMVTRKRAQAAPVGSMTPSVPARPTQEIQSLAGDTVPTPPINE